MGEQGVEDLAMRGWFFFLVCICVVLSVTPPQCVVSGPHGMHGVRLAEVSCWGMPDHSSAVVVCLCDWYCPISWASNCPGGTARGTPGCYEQGAGRYTSPLSSQYLTLDVCRPEARLIFLLLLPLAPP